MELQLVNVQSSACAAVGYHDGMMIVLFHNDDVYGYTVTEEQYTEVLTAESIGVALGKYRKIGVKLASDLIER